MLHWSLVRLAHCLLVIALNDVYYFEQINMMMMMSIVSGSAHGSILAISLMLGLGNAIISTVHPTETVIVLRREILGRT